MGNRYFTEEQVKQLQKNHNVVRASMKAITYHEDFKHYFIEKYNKGETPSQIFADAGFDTQALGKDRISNFSRRIRKHTRRVEGFRDTRKDNMGRPKVRELSAEEEVKLLKHKNDILKQENDFLKRVQYINKKNLSNR